VTNEGATFRVWAPSRNRVAVSFGDQTSTEVLELEPEGNGYFSGTRSGTTVGALYGFRLDNESRIYPDPASRYQPHGHDGLSQIVDPERYTWSDAGWRGVSRTGQVLYEMHVATFTREGTWSAAARALPWLAELGVTVLELMPVGEFPGRFGWGYDVVHYFAPTRLYGTPDDMRAFVDTAHGPGWR
jgi:maltooligosyltrehalose trehalohydrolase